MEVQSRYHRKEKSWIQKALDFLRAFIAFMFSNVGVIGLVVGYAILGSFVFIWIESPLEKQRKLLEKEVLEKRRELTSRLWKVTCCDVNIFSEDLWREAVAAELVKFQEEIVKAIQEAGYEGEGLTVNRWSFSAAFLYSLTVITSIGYGNVTPKTDGGKLATILYAIVGMPLFLLYLTTIGGVLASSFKWTYSKCCKCQYGRRKSRNYRTPQVYVDEFNVEEPDFQPEIESPSPSEDPQQITVPISLCLSIMIGYLYGGAVLFSNWEKWDLLDGAYFCFISLSTIGFGDIVPGEMISKGEGIEGRFIFCSIYLLLGMAIIAMCFNLMQEEVVQKIRNAGQRIKRVFGCARR